MKEFQWAKHKELWDELARTGEGRKEETKALAGESITMDCWCCEAVAVEEKDEIGEPALYVDCSLCPLAWPNGTGCSTNAGLYDAWCLADTEEERKEIAAQIRDLPLAKGWKTDKSGRTATFVGEE